MTLLRTCNALTLLCRTNNVRSDANEDLDDSLTSFLHLRPLHPVNRHYMLKLGY